MVDTSIFSRAARVFENVRNSSLRTHSIENPSISMIVRTSSRLFQMLDRGDPAQAEISRRLWVLRSSILFTLLPFDDSALNLREQVMQLAAASRGLPDANPLLESLTSEVMDIVTTGRNPKMECVLHCLDESGQTGEISVGLFIALSAGRPPGWPPLEQTPHLKQLHERIAFIRTRKELRSRVFERLILPCSCQNVPADILSELLYSGRSNRFDVLLYPGERFRISQRLGLPDDGILAGRRQNTSIDRESLEFRDAGSISTIETWMNEAFWQGLHGGARSKGEDRVSANYVLFCDGTGTFLPEGGRVYMLPNDSVLLDENDLRIVPVADVCDGDLIVLRYGESGYLLDEASELILSNSGDASLVERATDWKGGLEALLISHSNEEVAQFLRERGVQISAASINQWSGSDVLGPGNERLFKELIRLLVDRKKLSKSNVELSDYIASRWASLQSLRGVRHKAGNVIRQNLFKALFSRFESSSTRLGDKEIIRIDGDIGVELLILRVSTVDRNPAYVHPSRLCRIDDLKGNKWLG